MFTIMMSQGQGGMEVEKTKTLGEALQYVFEHSDEGSFAIRYPDGSYYEWSTGEEMNDPIYALAAAWASIDGKIINFLKGKNASFEDETEKFGGYYSGYMVEADELIKRLKKRGFEIRKIDG